MSKNQLGTMSKKQILQSLYQEQNQQTVTLSRLITATARLAGLDPKQLAEAFNDDSANQNFVEAFNTSLREKQMSNQAQPAQMPQQTPPSEDQNSEPTEDSSNDSAELKKN